MKIFWFPDNTVFCNFASVGRIDLLETILDGKGRWTEAVESEVRSSAYIAHRTLDPTSMRGWLGDPIETEDTEAGKVENVRVSVFGGTTFAPREHLGEAQTLYVIKSRSEFSEATWISDDRASLSYARRQSIRTLETATLMGVGCVNGDVNYIDAYGLLRQMIAQGNHLRLPAKPTDLLR